MKIAFYAPLKSPEHPTPSGDRLMARLLMAALRRAGHEVQLASALRSFTSRPAPARLVELEAASNAERNRIAAVWQRDGMPDLWFTYHPYYKAPDLVGPPLCSAFGIPYVTAECSYARKRAQGEWGAMQRPVLQGIRQASVNICMTTRDQAGLNGAAPEARLALLPPFIDAGLFAAVEPLPEPGALICVAMMREGDKHRSYAHLAAALGKIAHLPWTLTVVGDGPAAGQTQALFQGLPADRIRWMGERSAPEIARLLARASLYVWPGCGEAYGLAYLEAQAAALPVIAFSTAGVPEVVANGVTGLLTADRDDDAFAEAIAGLLRSEDRRLQMATAARAHVLEAHSLEAATRRLDTILKEALDRPVGAATASPVDGTTRRQEP